MPRLLRKLFRTNLSILRSDTTIGLIVVRPHSSVFHPRHSVFVNIVCPNRHLFNKGLQRAKTGPSPVPTSLRKRDLGSYSSGIRHTGRACISLKPNREVGFEISTSLWIPVIPASLFWPPACTCRPAANFGSISVWGSLVCFGSTLSCQSRRHRRMEEIHRVVLSFWPLPCPYDTSDHGI